MFFCDFPVLKFDCVLHVFMCPTSIKLRKKHGIIDIFMFLNFDVIHIDLNVRLQTYYIGLFNT